MSAEGLQTRFGRMDWTWKDNAMHVRVSGGRCKIGLGPAFKPGTPLRAEFAQGR